MKRKLLSSFGRMAAVLTVLAMMPVASLADVNINETNFPDEKFRAWLLAQDYGKDGILTEDEIQNITEIDVSRQGIKSLEGINTFTELQLLSCYQNELTELDVSSCTALQNLSCGNNKLTELDVSKCTNLRELNCPDNLLGSLDVSNCTELTVLFCLRDKLTSLNVSNCKALEYLFCEQNQLAELDLSDCMALKKVNCYINQIRGEKMAAFIDSLPNVEHGELYVYLENYSEEGNICTTDNVNTAKTKGWKVYYQTFGTWIEYNGSWLERYENQSDENRRLIHSIEIEGSTYALYKEVVDRDDIHMDLDGMKTYRSKLTLEVTKNGGTSTYLLDDEVYYNLNDLYAIQPIQVDMDARKIYVFTHSKDEFYDYGYSGFAYVSALDEIDFMKEIVFTRANMGHYSRFIKVLNGRIAVAHFQYAGYYAVVSIRSAGGKWTNITGDYVDHAQYAALWKRLGENVLVTGKDYEELNDEQYNDAIESIPARASQRFRIYTICDTPEGNKVYYLTNTGTLTDSYDEAPLFYFQQVKTSNLYAPTGLKLNKPFSNPHPWGEQAGVIVPQGAILTDALNRNDWETQVWFKKGDSYAVRATNALSMLWGADTYWTVLDTNGDGQPEADYSLTPNFVWYLLERQADPLSVETIKEDTDAPLYDLSGRRLQGKPVQKGIYVKDGKKILYK